MIVFTRQNKLVKSVHRQGDNNPETPYFIGELIFCDIRKTWEFLSKRDCVLSEKELFDIMNKMSELNAAERVSESLKLSSTGIANDAL